MNSTEDVSPPPVPDPTVLTTEQLVRTARAERDYTDGQIAVVDQRLRGIDIATKLLSETVNRVPTDVAKEVRHITGLMIEKFTSVDNQFSLLEKQRTEQKSDTKAAVDAALCCSADTPILCADLVWRPAGDLLPGDELVAFDEDTFEAQGGARGRRYRKAVVTGNFASDDILAVVNTTQGSVRCNYKHKWLTKTRGRAWKWTRTADLKSGSLIAHPLDAWEVENTYEAGWLSGILDGEGCLTFQSRQGGAPRLSIGQVAGITADHIDKALRSRVGTIGTHTRPAGTYGKANEVPHGLAQAQCRWQVDGRADIMKLLGSIRPERLLVNSDKVWEGFVIRGKHRDAKVTSVEYAGAGVIANLSTSTGTYIANGFCSKNTAQKEAVREQTTASERAISKSEMATAKQLDQLSATFGQALEGVTIAVNDLKDRLNRNEGTKGGLNAGWVYLVGALAAAASLAAVIGVVIAVTNR